MVRGRRNGPMDDAAGFDSGSEAAFEAADTDGFESDPEAGFDSAEAYGNFFISGSGYSGRRRRRRGSNKRGDKVQNQALQQKQQKRQQQKLLKDEAIAMERVLGLLRQQDVVGCGMKLICELAGFREEDLTEEQFTILNMIEPRTKPGEGLLPSRGAATDYREAKRMGQNHLNCSLNFPQCPLNATQLMDVIDVYVP